jgi:hypothetical protein
VLIYLSVVALVIAEALLSLLACGTLGLFLVKLIHSTSLSLAVHKCTGESSTMPSVSSGHGEEVGLDDLAAVLEPSRGLTECVLAHASTCLGNN